jgi:hypothetical protein
MLRVFRAMSDANPPAVLDSRPRMLEAASVTRRGAVANGAQKLAHRKSPIGPRRTEKASPFGETSLNGGPTSVSLADCRYELAREVAMAAFEKSWRRG